MADDQIPDAPEGAPTVNTDTPTAPSDLGDAGKRAISEERRARTAAEREAKAAKAELEALRAQSMTDSEKAVAAARAEGEQSALAKANQRILRADVRAAAAGKFADPADAVQMIELDDIKIDDDGNPDVKQITRLLDALLREKPYLAAGPRTGGSFDGGARQQAPAGEDMNALLRQAAGRG